MAGIANTIAMMTGGQKYVAEDAKSLAEGTLTYADLKSRADKMSKLKATRDNVYVDLGSEYLDKVAAESKNLGAFNSELNQLYRAASVNSADMYKTPDESQAMYRVSSAAAGARTAQASAAGSSVPKSAITAVQAEASKRTLMGS